ncbi:MAG: MFS transporter [Gemmataceae bacterium]
MGPMDSTGGPKLAVPGAGKALALLLAINLFNYIDRQILSATLPKIDLDAGIFETEDPNRSFKLGLLTTGFLVSYMLLSPVFAWLGDKMSRWALVGAAVIVWSLATGGTGLAETYVLLLVTRCLVGIGEAAYGPVAPTMLSDLYPVEHRGRIMAWFYLAVPVGSALGFVVGGAVADSAWGWRGAFLVVVVPGLILGALCFLMKDRRSEPVAKAVDAPSYGTVLRELRGNRSFVFCCAGMTLSTFMLGGVAAWAPVYIFEREGRFTITDKTVLKLRERKRSDGSAEIPDAVVAKVATLIAPDEKYGSKEYQARLATALSRKELADHGGAINDAATAADSLTTGKIGLYFGAIVVVSGFLATLLGGLLGDWLRNRGVKGAYFHVAGWGTVLGFPFFLGMLYAPFPWAWVFMFFAVFWLFFNTGPANTILANVTRPRIRATAFAMNILIIHALGDAISPSLIGLVRDDADLQTAFLVTSLTIPAAGLLWVLGAKHLDADTANAEA